MVSAQTQRGEEPTVNRAAERACDPGPAGSRPRRLAAPQARPDRGDEAPLESHHVGHLVAIIQGPGRPTSKDHWPREVEGSLQPRPGREGAGLPLAPHHPSLLPRDRSHGPQGAAPKSSIESLRIVWKARESRQHPCHPCGPAPKGQASPFRPLRSPSPAVLAGT